MNCIFCRIIANEIPSVKLVETAKVLSFLDIGPLSKGHALVIPKHCCEKIHDVPDDDLSEVLTVAKRVILALRKENLAQNYNILQNNGALAHQEVKHVHFHIIPKTPADGLNMDWKPISVPKEELVSLKERLDKHLL